MHSTSECEKREGRVTDIPVQEREIPSLVSGVNGGNEGRKEALRWTEEGTDARTRGRTEGRDKS